MLRLLNRDGWAGALVGLILIAPCAVAQQPADTTRLEPVVVTANRLPTPVGDVPAAVTILEGRELEARGIDYVADALRDVAGVDVARNGSYGGVTSAFVRGGESDYLKVLVDGVSLNDPGGAIDLAHLTMDNVDRIEIVRGPVSVLYGSDAVSGVVQIFTRRGTGALRGDVSVRGGTYKSVDANGGIAGGTNVLDYALSAARSRTDGIYESNNDYSNTVWSGTIGVRPDDRTDARVTLRYGASQYHFPTDGLGAVVDDNAFQRRDQIVLGAEAGRFLSGGMEARLTLGLNQADGGIDDRPDGPADTLGYFAYSSLYSAIRRSADLRVNAFLPAATVLTVGGAVEWQRERSADETLSEFGPSGSSFDATRTNGGLYAQVQATPIAPLAVTVGGRLDENSAFGTFVSYRAGARYVLPTGTRVRGAAGKGFKEPTFFENFAAGPFARGNPDLRPERSQSWEIGIEQALWNGTVVVAATYFDQKFRDLVQYSFGSPDPSDPDFFNVAAAAAAGIEAELTVTAPLGLRITGAYTYLRTEVVDAGEGGGVGSALEEGARLLRRPTHGVSVVARQQIRNRGSVSATVRYVGDRDDLDFGTFPAARVTLPWYVRVDIAAEVRVWRAVGEHPAVGLTGRLENLFDTGYREVHGFLTPGRTIAVGLKVTL
jgi:vitamin B12 transporter